MAELDVEIGRVQHEMNERQAKGKTDPWSWEETWGAGKSEARACWADRGTMECL